MQGKCGKCGGDIRWQNRRPVNLDGSEHWDTCKEIQFRAARQFGTPYQTENESGYVYRGTTWRTWLRGPTVTGAKYVENTCDCGLPPWELCEEGCSAQI